MYKLVRQRSKGFAFLFFAGVMASLSHPECKLIHSWWWDSRNTAKNSTRLQEHITDIDGKVKTMIKLIEEDADSFARMAEMYYKKRPELVKLVGEFYRAYRPLTERYRRAMRELHHARQTTAAAFPHQVPSELVEDLPSPTKDGEPDVVLDEDGLIGNAHELSASVVHAVNRGGPVKDDSGGAMRKRGLKQLQEMFGGDETAAKSSKLGDERVRRGPKKVKNREEDELMRLSNENRNLKEMLHNEAERAGKAEREVRSLKKALADMEAEKEDIRLKYQQCLGRICEIEEELKNAQMETMNLDEKATRAEIEVHTLKEALVQLEVEKIAEMIKHEECLEKISHLEAMASRFQENKNALDDRVFEAENQVRALKHEMTRLELEKETMVEGLNNDILIGNVKLVAEKEKSSLLEVSNQVLQVEADDLAKKIAVKDLELSDKQEELEKLQCRLLEMLKDVDETKHGLEEEIQKGRDVNRSLSETAMCSAVSTEILQNEILSLRKKSKEQEERCDLLKDDRSNLSCERDTLALTLDDVEKRLTGLEEKHADLENENKAMHCQVEKLKLSLCEENRIAVLQNKIHLLADRWKKKETEEEVDKTPKVQFEIYILCKFMKDIEEKNCSLIIECQKHMEVSKLAEKMMSEFELQVETELLLDEIKTLRLGMYQIFRALETDLYSVPEEKVEDDRAVLQHILESIEDMKSLISKHEDEKQHLLVENSVLVALLEQLESNGVEIDSQKMHLEGELKIMADKYATMKNDKEKLVEINGHLKSQVESLYIKQEDFQSSYNALEEAFSKANRENAYLLKKLSNLTEEKQRVDQHKDAVFLEFLAAANQSAVLKSFADEKTTEIKSLLEDLIRQHDVNSSLKDTVSRLEREMEEVGEYNDRMKININKLMQINEELENTIFLLSETNSEQKKEIESLRRVNKDLESEHFFLRQEMEHQGTTDELDLWENNVSKFCFDLDVSSVDEVLLKNKVHELAGAYQSLEHEHARKESEIEQMKGQIFSMENEISRLNAQLSAYAQLAGAYQSLEHEHARKESEIEQMKGQICSMENEISRLNAQLSAYAPLVASLRDDITLIEHNALLSMKFKAGDRQETEFLEEVDSRSSHDATQILLEDQSIVSLKNLQMRINAVGKLMEAQNNSINNSSKLQNVRNQILIKDIPLDQVSVGSTRKKGSVGSNDPILELWGTVEDGNGVRTLDELLKTSFKLIEKSDLPSTDSVDKLELSTRITRCNQEVNDEKVLKKLAFDAKKLASLRATLENLRRKVGTNKKSKKGVKEDLKEAEDTLVRLSDLNGQLVKNIKECPNIETSSPMIKETVRTRRSKVMEEVKKGSESIDMLQLSIERIELMVSKMEDDGKNKGVSKMMKSRSGLIKDFFQKSIGRKKGHHGGSSRKSTNGDRRCL